MTTKLAGVKAAAVCRELKEAIGAEKARDEIGIVDEIK